LHIYIQHARALEVVVDGHRRILYTHSPTLAQALAEARIPLSPTDRIEPDPSSPVYDGMKVVITRAWEERVVERATVPPRTIYRLDPQLGPGERRWIAGRAGVRYREVMVTYEGGKVVRRTVLREWWDPPPQDTVVLWGAKRAAAGEECLATLPVFATWYTPASAGKPPSSPSYGITATGLPVRKGIVAVDPRVIPLGTRLFIPGYGLGIAADTGGAVKGYHIDLGYPDGVAVDWTNRWVEVCILG